MKSKKTKTKAKIKAKAPKKAVKKPAKKIAVRKIAKSDERLGLFGGAFNPIHVGHLNSAMTVKMELGLDKILFIPLHKSAYREVTGPSPAERVMLIQEAITGYEQEFQCDESEIKRGGITFTVDTLKEFNKTHKPENLYFIMGADAFKQFHTWREFPELLKLANFVVTTRPGAEVSLFEGDIAEELQKYVKSSDGKKILLNTKRTIQLVTLEDINISSTDIRKRLRAGGDVKAWLPPKVLELIKAKGFYQRSVPAVKDYKQFTSFCAEQAKERKALSLKIYDMSRLNAYADYSIICSGTSTRHTTAVAENIIEKVKEEYGLAPLSFEGAREGHWVLIDYGPVVVHVFEDAERAKYQIEKLWQDCPQIQ